MRWLIGLAAVVAATSVSVPLLDGLLTRLDSPATAPVVPADAAGASTAPATRTMQVPVTTTVYRWRDAAGTVHYESGPPPPGVEAQALTLRGQKSVQITPGQTPGTRAQGGQRGRVDPLSVYAPGGTDKLLERLDETLQTMQRHRAVLESMEKDL